MAQRISINAACVLASIAAGAALIPSTAMAQFVEPDVSVLYTLTSDEAGDGFGFVAEAIGDVNGDGASEIIVGAVGNTSGGPFAGKAFVYSGRDGTLLNSVTGSPLDFLGHSVAGVGDADADRVPDYAVGDPAYGAADASVGAVDRDLRRYTHDDHRSVRDGAVRLFRSRHQCSRRSQS